MSTDLRLGRWQDVLVDVGECDALITDPPYSKRTDEGYMSHGMHESAQKTDIGYRPIVEDDAREMCEVFSRIVKSWVVIFGDHISREWHAKAWEPSVQRWIRTHSRRRRRDSIAGIHRTCSPPETSMLASPASA